MYVIGVDLGTQSMKGFLVDAQGKFVAESSAAYDPVYPFPAWTEENPADWIHAFKKIVKDLMEISGLCRTYGITKCTKVIRGGETRAHSVLLAALEASPGVKLLAVQDGARPLVTPEVIERTISAAVRCGAAAPAVPVKDTVKEVRDGGAVERTVDRTSLRAVQTPQVFDASLLKAALQDAVENRIPITDDCSAVERLGKVVFLVDGEEENLKITTPVDMILAEAILRARENRA